LVEKKEEKEEIKEPEPIDYSFLDGLRGYGSLAVYFHHFLI
jgi:hypothetical protein